MDNRERSGVVQLSNGALSPPVGAEDLGANPFSAQGVGANGEVVTIQQSREATDSVIRQLWLVIGVAALLALGFAFVLAWFQSRRLA